METWPGTLPDYPNQDGYGRVMKPNVIRSDMGYGPAKMRKRTTANLYQVTMQLWLTQAQLDALDEFYDDNMALTWVWEDFGRNPTVTARYRFLAPPAASPLGAIYWAVSLSLEMDTDA